MTEKIRDFINDHENQLLQEITNHYQQHIFNKPANNASTTPYNLLNDLTLYLAYLGEAIALQRPTLFTDYILWQKDVLTHRNISEDKLICLLKSIEFTLQKNLSSEDTQLIKPYLEEVLTTLTTSVTLNTESIIKSEIPLADLAKKYTETLLQKDRQTASKLILEAVNNGVSVKDIYLYIFQVSQYEIGRLWQKNLITIAQEHYCTAATQLIMSQLYPHIFSTNKNGYKFLSTCVQNNLHEVGIRMVSDFLEMEGWDTIYLGANTPTESILQMVETEKPDIMAISATLTAHLKHVEILITQVKTQFSTTYYSPKIMVGGYPFNKTESLWHNMGANAHAKNALDAITTAEKLIKG